MSTQPKVKERYTVNMSTLIIRHDYRCKEADDQFFQTQRSDDANFLCAEQTRTKHPL